MKYLSLLSAFVLLSLNAVAQGDMGKSIDSLVQLTSPTFFNGVVLVSKDGNTLYKKSYGYSDLDKKTPLKMDDQFLVGSISKQFTATLVLREMQAGRIQAHQTI